MHKELTTAFDYFNKELFREALPACIVTLQRKRNAYGYFSGDRFKHLKNGEKRDEIAMNPDCFDRSLPEVLSTLVHEMCHQWQHKFGKPSRGGYHNKQWALKMKEVGLQPSTSGAEGGKETGPKVGHFIINGDRFDEAAGKLIQAGFKIEWCGIVDPPPPRKESKVKYSCPQCALNAWAKPDTKLICGDCKADLQAVD